MSRLTDYLSDYLVVVCKVDKRVDYVPRRTEGLKLEDCSELGSVLTGTRRGVKWYSHEDDVQEVVARFSDLRFAGEGRGEDLYDVWALCVQGRKLT